MIKNYKVRYISFKNFEYCFEFVGLECDFAAASQNSLTRLFNFFKKAIFEIKHSNNAMIIICQYKFNFLYKVLFPFRRILFDIRTGSVSESLFRRIIVNLDLTICGILYNHVSIIDNGLRKKLHIPVTKCSIIPLGAQSYSIKPKDYTKLSLFYIGTFSARSIDKTLKGFAEFLRIHPDSVYHIVGYGHNKEENELNKLVEELKLERSVFIHGRKRHSEIQNLFEECNVGISFVPIKPHYQHQPPTKLFEYLLSGMICIATRTEAQKKIINDDNGVLINDNASDFKWALVHIYNNRFSYHDDIIRCGAQQYKWETIISDKLIPTIHRVFYKKL
ncbi:MAG: glycosyltransferase family 4 protein [Clostridiaceae bacterium]|nr:glycosyltransferase family 4 protein [Clostridiaceae bacterium]